MALRALNCRQVQRAVNAFADGELSRERTLATSAHLARCAACRRHARLQQALHDGTRRAVHRGGNLAPDFEHRVREALEHERLEETRARLQEPRRPVRLRWGLLVAAPLIGLALVALTEPPATRPLTQAPRVARSSSTEPVELDQVVDAMIALHATPAPAATRPVSFRELEREVGLPVRAPAELERHGATLLGASRVALGDQPVASLAYRLASHRCTLFLYDDARLPLRHSRYLAPKAVDQRPVFVGTRRGYALAAVERRGLGYAIATDLDADEAARLAAAIH